MEDINYYSKKQDWEKDEIEIIKKWNKNKLKNKILIKRIIYNYH
jgi:hypothetical protein